MLLPSTRIIQPELASNNFTVEERQYRLHPGTAGFKNPSLLTLQRVFMAPARLPISASARLSHLWPPPTMTFEGPVSIYCMPSVIGIRVWRKEEYTTAAMYILRCGYIWCNEEKTTIWSNYPSHIYNNIIIMWTLVSNAIPHSTKPARTFILKKRNWGPCLIYCMPSILGIWFGRKDAQQQPCIHQVMVTFDTIRRRKLQYGQTTLPTSTTS